ncbi:MAG: histidinol-phosphatase HisJ family protein [Spirochaetaceae bacterium]|nr:histidinol-phosphatase HisJ family protein [Spirochaetaceae bacterium]
MKLYDQHLHSRHSVDSNADPVANCERALAAGLAGLTFTEHYDMHPRDWDRCRWDYDAIAATIDGLRRRFSPELWIGFGIEVDYQPEMIEETLDYLDRHPFDLVLLSVHWIGGRPPREWREIGAEAMRRAYLVTLRGAAELCRELAAGGRRPFDVLGHLDYVKRYLRRDWNVPMRATEPVVLDPILQALIDAGVVPEINTAGMRRPEDEAYPAWAILERYRELGGRAVSIGSDAHHSGDIGAGFGQAAERLQAMGFEGEAVFRERERSIVPW